MAEAGEDVAISTRTSEDVESCDDADREPPKARSEDYLADADSTQDIVRARLGAAPWFRKAAHREPLNALYRPCCRLLTGAHRACAQTQWDQADIDRVTQLVEERMQPDSEALVRAQQDFAVASAASLREYLSALPPAASEEERARRVAAWMETRAGSSPPHRGALEQRARQSAYEDAVRIVETERRMRRQAQSPAE
jgi:hypothetical protein